MELSEIKNVSDELWALIERFEDILIFSGSLEDALRNFRIAIDEIIDGQKITS